MAWITTAAGAALILAGVLLPTIAVAQILLPPPPPPQIETEVDISDEVLGILVGGSLGRVGFRGVAVDRLNPPFGGSAYLAGEFETVHEVRVGIVWSNPHDQISQTAASVRALDLELHWRIFDERIKLQGGPRFGWYRVERDWWQPDTRRGSLSGGGALVALVPVSESFEVEGRFSLTGFTLTDPAAEAAQELSDKPAWIRTFDVGLRYRLR